MTRKRRASRRNPVHLPRAWVDDLLSWWNPLNSNAAIFGFLDQGGMESATLDASMIDVIDAALELHGRRATIIAINNFVQHLTQKRFDMTSAQALCGLNPRDYSMNWECRDDQDLANFGESMGVIDTGVSIKFVLEVKARAKKETRVKKAKETLAKQSSALAQLPPLPVLNGRDAKRSKVESANPPAGGFSTVETSVVFLDNSLPTAGVAKLPKPEAETDRAAFKPDTTHSSLDESNVTAPDDFKPEDALARLKLERFYEDQCCFEHLVNAHPGEFIEFEDDRLAFISSRVKSALQDQWKVKSLYAHQVEAIRASLEQSHVLLLTGTGSGKTLCFATVVAERIARDRGLDVDPMSAGGGFLVYSSAKKFRSLFLYPTKALAQDQLRALKSLFAKESIVICTVDGDSTPSERQVAREEADVILTNPDFLHCTMLPRAFSEWRPFVSSIGLVVIDEAHTFNGSFGCHCSFVIRRLLRLADSQPSFFVCSATIGNPQQTFERLTGLKPNKVRVALSSDEETVSISTSPEEQPSSSSSSARLPLTPTSGKTSVPSGTGEAESYTTGELPNSPSRNVHSAPLDGEAELINSASPEKESITAVLQGKDLVLVTRDCSPQGRRLIALWRPKVIKVVADGREKRASAIFEMARVFSSMVRSGIRTLAFCKTRKLVELVLKYTYDLLEDQSRVMAYRGGYTKQSRREIEQKMFSGELLGICCTSALELGIDIGSCDCVLVLGVSGAASMTQMFGRAGRKGRNALNICVCFDGVLDRILLKRPEAFLERQVEESAVFDVRNEVISKKHLLCAAKENPLDFSVEESIDCELFDSSLSTLFARAMKEDELLVEEHPLVFRIKDKVSKPHDFSLRMIEGNTIALIDDETKQSLDEIEYFRAFFELYPGAIYLHQSRTYCVVSVDLAVRHQAIAKRIKVDYYTSPLNDLQIRVEKVFETKTEMERIGTGIVRLTHTLTGFRKRRFNLEDVYAERMKDDRERFNVFLPPLEYSTRATWIDLGDEDTLPFVKGDEKGEYDWGCGLHAVRHLMCKAMGTLISSHWSSIATTHDGRAIPNRLIIFDKDPGGIGIADAVFDRIHDCLHLAKELLDSCKCENGCEECVFEHSCSAYNWDCNKQAARRVLDRALVVIGSSDKCSVVQPKSRFTTPRKLRRAKRMAKDRAAGTQMVPLWKRHLPQLGSEHVEFESEF